MVWITDTDMLATYKIQPNTTIYLQDRQKGKKNETDSITRKIQVLLSPVSLKSILEPIESAGSEQSFFQCALVSHYIKY